jgi:predicted RNA binding protein YcfA (HicA-like mRNA interferase family)
MKVRDVIRMVERDGWFEVAQRGSHRQFKHPAKPGKVTVAGHPSAEMAKETYNKILKQAGIK